MKDGEGKLTLLVVLFHFQEACKASSLVEATEANCGAMAGMAVAFCQLVRHDKACPSETLKVILFLSMFIGQNRYFLVFFQCIFDTSVRGPWKVKAHLRSTKRYVVL